MRVYVHKEGTEKLEAVDLEEKSRVAELAGRHSATDEGVQVWVEDSEIPLSDEVTLLEAGVGDRAHVFVGTRSKITVSVFFNNTTIDDEVRPMTRIKKIFKWATGKRGFDLGRADRAEHVLVLLGTQDRPDDDTHVGSLAGADARVEFELMSRERWQGDGA